MAWTGSDVELYHSAFGEMAMQINGHRRSSVPWPLPGYQALAALPEEKHEQLWGRPVYYRAFSRANGGPKVEDDLFAGIR